MIATRGPGAVDERRDDEPGHRRDGADREVDAAGQHRQRLAAGQDRQRHGRAEHDADPVGVRRSPGVTSSIRTTSSAEQAEQRDDRALAEQVAPRRPRSSQVLRSLGGALATPLTRAPAGSGRGCRHDARR